MMLHGFHTIASTFAAILLVDGVLAIENDKNAFGRTTDSPLTMMVKIFANDATDDEVVFYQRVFFTALVALWTIIPMISYWKRRIKLTNGGAPFLGTQPEGISWPFLGQALNYLKYRPWDLMMKWHRSHGPIFGFELFGSMFVSVASPSLLKQVLQSKIASVKKDVANTMKHFLVILGTGIVTSEDDSWMKQRLKLSMPLRRDVLEWIPTQTLIAVQRLCETSLEKSCDDGSAIPMGSSLRHLTLQVISATFLSLSAEESDSNFAKLYLPIVDESNARVWHPYRAYCFFMPFFWKHLWNGYNLNVYVSNLIRKRWQERRAAKVPEIHDILDRLLHVYETEFPGEEILPESAVKQFRDEMKTFMLAGHETSAAMMTWTLYELMGNDKLRQEVLDEAKAVFPATKKENDDSVLHTDNLSKLALSEACLKESLRKYSVVPIVARRTINDLTLTEEAGNGETKNYFVPKGCSVMINIQAIHMDPTLWPNPTKFDPQRFLTGKPLEPFTFVPFIAGPRNCLGQHLALLESKMVISLLLKKYKFSLPKGKVIQVHDWKFGDNDSDPRHRYIIPVIPKEELMVHVSRR